MILTCPACRCSYKVPEGAITATGRKVRCAGCAHVWHATIADVSMSPPVIQQAAPQQYMQQPQAAPSQMPPPSDEMAARTAAIREAMMDEEDATHDPIDYDEPEIESAPQADLAGDGSLDFGLGDDEKSDFDLDSFAEGLSDKYYDVKDKGMSLFGKFFKKKSESEVGEAESLEVDGTESEDKPAKKKKKKKPKSKVKLKLRLSTIKSYIVTALWVPLIGGWIGLAVGFILMPEKVKEIWPPSVVILDMLEGMDLEEQIKADLEEQGVKLSPAFIKENESITNVQQRLRVTPPKFEFVMRGGKRQMVLTGLIDNEGAKSIRVPEFRAVIYDLQGKPIKWWMFKAPKVILLRGEQTEYKTVTPDGVPVGAHSVGVEVNWTDDQLRQQDKVDEANARAAAAKEAAETPE